jgi:hypothetical protein
MGLYQNTVRWIVYWMQEKPEVIAYLRYLYTDNALPDWVGKFKEDVDYAEILRRAGVEVPAIVDDASASASEDARVSEDEEEDVQEGTSAQGGTMVANDFSAQAGAGGRGASQAGAHGRTAQAYADADAAEARKETQEKTVLQRSSKIPDQIVNPNPEPLPVVVKKPQYTKRGMGGSGVLEGMGVAEVRRVLQEKLVEERGEREKWSHYFYYIF